MMRAKGPNGPPRAKDQANERNRYFWALVLRIGDPQECSFFSSEKVGEHSVSSLNWPFDFVLFLKERKE